MMTIKEFVEVVTRYLAGLLLAGCFSGNIIITINAHKGGIGTVQVSVSHELTKDD
jgi:hypothetical protein